MWKKKEKKINTCNFSLLMKSNRTPFKIRIWDRTEKGFRQKKFFFLLISGTNMEIKIHEGFCYHKYIYKL